MIIEYQRPKTVAEALSLLAREQPVSYPLGGGTHLNRPQNNAYAVVDLQALGLDGISKQGNSIQVGGTSSLQQLLEYSGLPEDFYKALRLEATYNLRQMATIAGTLVTANGRSPLATLLLCMDGSLEILELDQAPRQVKLGDWMPVRGNRSPGQLISKLTFANNLRVAYESVARTPADQPIVCAATAQWKSGRTRLALGGWGKAPILAMDGPEADGLEVAARDAYSQAADEWASAEYRSDMAGVLATRCISKQ